MLHDIFHDVLRRVEHTARLLDFRLVLHLCLVAVREPDYFPEELLVDVAEDRRGDDREQVRRLGIVKPFDDAFEHFVVNGHRERKSVGQFVRILLLLEVEEPGVVFSSACRKNRRAAHRCARLRAVCEASGLFDPPVLADAQEEEPVDGALHDAVEFLDRKPGIPDRDVLARSDRHDSISERISSSTPAVPFLPLFESAYCQTIREEYSPARKWIRESSHFSGSSLYGEVLDPPLVRSVTVLRFYRAVVDCELLEVREDGEREFRIPRIAAHCNAASASSLIRTDGFLVSTINFRVPPILNV